MKKKLGIIADCLVGAENTVEQFARLGISSMLILNHEPIPADIKVGVINTDSRNFDETKAISAVKEAVQCIKNQNVSHFFKKMDSRLRGHFVIELETIMDELRLETALIAPAFPASQRITAGGYHFDKQIPVSQSQDLMPSINESHLPSLVREKSSFKVGVLDLGTIIQGIGDIHLKILRMRAEGFRMIVCDATTQEHLDEIARIIWEYPTIIGCGSIGLVQSMATQKVN